LPKFHEDNTLSTGSSSHQDAMSAESIPADRMLAERAEARAKELEKKGKHSSMEEEEERLFEDVIPASALEVGKIIGEGAFGSVHVGELYGQPVALKRFKISDDNRKEDIMNEVRVMRTLRHPNVVEYLGVAVFQGALAIVSEFMEGGTLDDLTRSYTKAGKKMRMHRVLKILKDIARGLSWLHLRGIIHRDLKPTNILLDEDKRKCKIADFGLAHVKTTRKNTGHYGMCGTMCYAAPEVLDKKDYGVSADVFSFAMVATEVIDGEYPLTLEMIPTNDFTSAIVRGVRPDVPKRAPPKLQKLLQECWSTRERERPTAIKVFKRLMQIGIEVEQKALEDPLEHLQDVMDDLPQKAIKTFESMQQQITLLKTELKQEKEKVIKARAEAQTFEAELKVLKAIGAVIDQDSGLPQLPSIT